MFAFDSKSRQRKMSARTQSSRRAPDRPRTASRRRFLFGLGIGLTAVLSGALITLHRPVLAQGGLLDQARADGTVGERYDGYAVVRDPNASAAVRDLVADVNAQRKRVYETRAASEGVSVGQVGRIYAQEIIEDAPAGTWFLLESNEWVQR